MNLVENVQKYIQTQIELSKLEVQDQLETAFKRVAMLLVLILSGVFMLAFLLITLAIGINAWLGSSWIGFLITALLWLLPIWFCIKSLKTEQ